MISYARGLPMIHDTRSAEEGGWAYSDSWNDVLQPLGIPCSLGNLTYKWSWNYNSRWEDDVTYCRRFQYKYQLISLNYQNYYSLGFPTDNQVMVETKLLGFSWMLNMTSNQLPYPLHAGLVVSKTIYDYSLKLPIDSNVWWISQFVKYAMRLKQSTRDRIEKDQEEIGFKPNDCIA
jgi:hypothetical protein